MIACIATEGLRCWVIEAAGLGRRGGLQCRRLGEGETAWQVICKGKEVLVISACWHHVLPAGSG